MNRAERMELIKNIESKCNCKLLIYITGDRRTLETKIATDIFPMFHKHLIEIGKQEQINLFIYSTGGVTIAGYALVNLIREFCDKFDVIIPFKALSCATLISLGADNIIMTPIGQLSPIDPSIDHPLGPQVQLPGQPISQIAPINIEDVNGFIDMAKDEFGLKQEDSLKKIFEILTNRIHPLALGSVQRTREQITFLASNLMKYHYEDQTKIDEITKILIRERFSHDYIINRREAREILQLEISDPDQELTSHIMELFNAYNHILDLDSPYNPETILGTENSKIVSFNRGIIESSNITHVYRTKKELRRVQPQQPGLPIQPDYQERILEDGWIEDNQI